VRANGSHSVEVTRMIQAIVQWTKLV